MKFELPKFLEGRVNPEYYNRWLKRKARAHIIRDRKRIPEILSNSDFQHRIHKAVEESNGVDYYTGKPLEWEKLSQYNNEDSKNGKSKYLKELRQLPTVDHEFAPESMEFVFRICAWETNDCKSHLSHAELIVFCESVLQHNRKKSFHVN